MQFSRQIKKWLLLAGSAISLSFLYVGISSAQEAGTSPNYLEVIANNTTAILGKVNNIPDYIQNATSYILNWQKPDDSQSTADMQVNFDAIGKTAAQNTALQNAQQAQIIADILGISTSDLINPKNSPAVLNTVPQVNSLAYSTVLGMPPAAKGAASVYDYVKNAASINVKHEIPRLSWSGSAQAKEKYQAYFNTVSAIESFDAYVLSNLLAEAQNGQALTTAQNNLLTQASNSSWIAQIASEELGKVLRQILMFQSQTYVLLTQLLQTQKQQLTATAMTNSLLILNAQMVELQLKGRAKGSMSAD